MPNTNFREFKLKVVNGPALTWLAPERSACAAKTTRLLVVASSTRPIRSVRFFDGSKRIATVKRGGAGLYGTTWKTKGARKGKHVLRAVVTDRSGAKASATWPVRVCR